MSTTAPINPIPCRICRQIAEESEALCPHCGYPWNLIVPWYHRLFGIVVLLFFIAGPLAIPFLWKSPIIPRQKKVSLTIASLLYSLVIIASILQGYFMAIQSLTNFP